jgi:hypothetical protein
MERITQPPTPVLTLLSTPPARLGASRERFWSHVATLAQQRTATLPLINHIHDLASELAVHGASPEQIADHPAVRLLVAGLAERAGLHFTYPIHLVDELRATLDDHPHPAA